jgi:SAM-dependent methyltransferase
VWALLLTQEQTAYPQIAAVLPEMPAPELQVIWNGTSGLELAAQSSAFYERLREIQRTHGAQPLEQTRVLDFGCGWGRLTRFLARDVERGRLFGCDLSPILDVARQNRVPAMLAASEFVPERVPFDERFDLAYAFSVFTHLSEHAHEASLNALHAAIRPGGLLAATIRPPEYLRVSPLLYPALAELGPEPAARLAEPRYLYAPHEQLPLNYDEGRERSYGETVITLAYIRERWSERFELLDVHVSAVDPQQIVLVLRRR